MRNERISLKHICQNSNILTFNSKDAVPENYWSKSGKMFRK